MRVRRSNRARMSRACVEVLEDRQLLATGALDPSFGNAGLVYYDIADNSNENMRDVLVQPDGKVLIAGNSTIPALSGQHEYSLVRLNPDGSLDQSFGNGGRAVHHFEWNDDISALALQPDGRIIGVSGNGIGFNVIRLNADGSLDTTFAGDGEHTYTIDNRTAGARAVALQPDGKIVVGGTTGYGNDYQLDWGLIRLNPDGSLDTGFGDDGIVLTNHSHTEAVKALLVQPDGKIIAGGQSESDFALIRFNPDGSVDGRGRVNFGWDEAIEDMVLEPDGSIVAAGSTDWTLASVPWMDHWGLARFRPDLTLDTSFGFEGRVRLDMGPGADTVDSLMRTPDGKLIVVGEAGIIGFGSVFGLAALMPNGALDTTFGTGGRVLTPFHKWALPQGADLQPDGRIVAAGIFAPGTNHFDAAAARYLGVRSPLTVAALGPFSMTEGERIILQAQGVGDPDKPFVFEWDLDYDGMTFDRDVSGAHPVYTPAGLDGFGLRNIAVRLRDADGNVSNISSTTLHIENVAPTFVIDGIPAAPLEGTQLDLGIVATDPSPADVLSYAWTVTRDGAIYAAGDSADIRFTADNEGTYVVAVTVADDDGGSTSSSFDIDVANAAPSLSWTVSPEAVNENDGVELHLTATDPGSADRLIVSVQWGDGAESRTILEPGAGRHVTFPHRYLDDPAGDAAAYNITVSVGDFVTGVTYPHVLSVPVANVAPDVTLAASATTAVPRQQLTFTGGFTDPGTLDTHEYAWDFGDGMTTPFTPTGDAGGIPAATHTYLQPGVYTVTLRVRDDDGAVGTATRTVRVEGVALLPDACDPQRRMLVVAGSSRADVIRLVPGPRGGVRVLMNGVSRGVFNDVTRIVAYGGAGNDAISAAGGVTLPLWVDGGDGNDRIDGGASHDILLGGAGRDVLVGIRGRDTLVGGAADDILLGNADDTRVQGEATYDIPCSTAPITKRPKTPSSIQIRR